eukprot:gb/GECG01004922.1/.p1 GENE.gb/GECG01004922.1/~~gb/GECG01004922.1/.p1  ORF type:complete len:368 (+),score=52.09 gb/GECG01004922.1/:1-1104(+)
MTSVEQADGQEEAVRRIYELHRSQFHDHTPRQVMYTALEQLDTTVTRMFALVSEACDSTPESAKRTSGGETSSQAKGNTVALQTKIKKLYTRMNRQLARSGSSATGSAASGSRPETYSHNEGHSSGGSGSDLDHIALDPQAPFRRDNSIRTSLHRRFARVLEDLASAKEMMLLAISKISEHLRQEEQIHELQQAVQQKRKQLHEFAEAKIQNELDSFERKAKQRYYYQQERAVLDSEYLKDKSNLNDIVSFIDRIRATIFEPKPQDSENVDFHERPVPEEGLLEKSTLLHCNLHETVNVHTGSTSDPRTSVCIPSFHAANADDVGRWFGARVGHEWNQQSETHKNTGGKKKKEVEDEGRMRKRARVQ